MDAEAKNLQNDFFNTARKDRSNVTIFLSNGKKLVGRIRSFDKFTLLLESHYGQQIIFKHAISTVSIGGGPRGNSSDDGGRRDAGPEARRPGRPDEG